MAESFCGEDASGIHTPWTIRAWLAPVLAATTLNRNDLVFRACGPDTGDDCRLTLRFHCELPSGVPEWLDVSEQGDVAHNHHCDQSEDHVDRTASLNPILLAGPAAHKALQGGVAEKQVHPLRANRGQ